MYNTVLGAKPLQPDGTAFYYSDYSYQGHKGYSRHRWPCCSGTLPQIAADYHISAYFHDVNDLYVNLYIPSMLNWQNPNARGSLTLTGEYPFAEVILLELKLDRSAEFSIHLRIPEWTKDASVSVNGKRQPTELKPRTFANLHRQWKTGDRIELHLPMTTRLEAIDPQHPDIVALMYGPLVLFPLTNAAPSATRSQLLAAKPSGPKSWQAQSASGPLALIPFTEIADQAYTTYLRIT